MCPECETTGKCWFKEKAEEIAANVTNRSNLDLLFGQALDAHLKTGEARIQARGRKCPNIDNINPEYHGKKLMELIFLDA